MQCKPPDRLGLVQALCALMRSARVEKGALDCRLTMDAEDPNALVYQESWRTRQDCEFQIRSPRYTRLLALMEMASEKPSLEFHFVTETHGLEYVAMVRGEVCAVQSQKQ